jgi:hypothetical protein
VACRIPLEPDSSLSGTGDFFCSRCGEPFPDEDDIDACAAWVVVAGEIPVCPGCATAIDKFLDDGCKPSYSRVPTEVMLQLLLNVETSEGDADASWWLR